jgi:hypothetical protein
VLIPYDEADGDGKLSDVGDGRDRPGGDGSWRFGAGGGFIIDVLEDWLSVEYRDE